MATWPSESTLFNTSITGADANPLMKAWLETNKQLVGAVAPVTLRIGNGSITPTAANILVDTEGGAAADTLSVIATSKMHDGAIILLRSADSSRKVTVQHSTGTGGLATVDAKNITLDTEWPLLACLVGDRWQEIPGARRAYDAASTPATHDKLGVVRIGEGIEVAQGVISVPPVPLATDAAPGLVRPDNVTCAVDAAGVLGGISMLCNTREVLTVSGTYTVPASGWYRVRNIGGGGAGGAGAKYFNNITDRNWGPGGGSGGTTQFGETPPALGGGGGAGGRFRGSGACPSSGGGGGAGQVVESYTYLTAGTTVPYIVGAGAVRNIGIPGSSANTAGFGYGAGKYDGQGALGAGTSTTPQWNAGQTIVSSGMGGNGGINGTGYGSGGGGGQAIGWINKWDLPLEGNAAPDAEPGCGLGNTPTIPEASYGGAGGNGAIILEYYNPDKATA